MPEPVVHVHLLIVHRQGPRLDAPRLHVHYTDKKENEIFLIYEEIQMGSDAKSHMKKDFLIYEEMSKY